MSTLSETYIRLIESKMPHVQPDHDETGHYYLYQGVRYPSVTKELQTIKDGGLMNWKMNRALEYILEHFWDFYLSDPDQKELEKFIELAKLSPQLEFEKAGDIGRQVHDWREGWFKHIMKTGMRTYEYDVPESPAVQSGIRAIQKFVAEKNYEPVACELSLADPELKIGGMLDDIGLIDGELCLIDLKTSNIGDKNAYFLQVALYYYMFWKMTGITCQEFYILHASKTDGSYQLIPIPNIKQRINDAKLLLKLNYALSQIDAEKQKKTIVL